MLNSILPPMDRVKYKIEELYKASPAMLYQFITDPVCLARWFADEADVEGSRYVFTWNGADEEATFVDGDEDSRARFVWTDADDSSEYLEFRMYRAGVTDQTVLEVIDFCDDDEVADSKKLWRSQLQILRQEIGG